MNAGTIECIVTVILEVLLLRLRKRSPDERSEIQGLSFPHIVSAHAGYATAWESFVSKLLWVIFCRLHLTRTVRICSLVS